MSKSFSFLSQRENEMLDDEKRGFCIMLDAILEHSDDHCKIKQVVRDMADELAVFAKYLIKDKEGRVYADDKTIKTTLILSQLAGEIIGVMYDSQTDLNVLMKGILDSLMYAARDKYVASIEKHVITMVVGRHFNHRTSTQTVRSSN